MRGEDSQGAATPLLLQAADKALQHAFAPEPPPEKAKEKAGGASGSGSGSAGASEDEHKGIVAGDRVRDARYGGEGTVTRLNPGGTCLVGWDYDDDVNEDDEDDDDDMRMEYEEIDAEDAEETEVPAQFLELTDESDPRAATTGARHPTARAAVAAARGTSGGDVSSFMSSSMPGARDFGSARRRIDPRAPRRESTTPTPRRRRRRRNPSPPTNAPRSPRRSSRGCYPRSSPRTAWRLARRRDAHRFDW